MVEFIAIVAASLGQFLDARTTQVALDAKVGREANFVSKFLIERLGFVAYYIIKAGLFPAIGFALHSTNYLFYTAGIGVACAAWNYLTVLRKNKLSIF